MFNYTISPHLLKLIKEISLASARLEAFRLSKTVLYEFENEALSLSSHSSTSIEGNPLPLTEVRKLLKNRPNQIRDTEREVLQYNDTLLWLHKEVRKNSFQLNEKVIIKIHTSIMKGLLPSIKLGGYRKEPVLVNDPHKRKPIFWPPDYQEVKVLMNNLLDFLKREKNNIDPLILAGIFHKQFVLIHPFIDGNGRTVRLATKILLAKMGLNTFSLFSFENYYNRNVSKYFQCVGEKGDYYDLQKKIDFTVWLEYFCEGVLDELLRVENALLKTQSHKMSGDDSLSPIQTTIINYIHEHNFIRDADYAKITTRAKATRALDFKLLIELGIIERYGKGPATYYRLKAKNN